MGALGQDHGHDSDDGDHRTGECAGCQDHFFSAPQQANEDAEQTSVLGRLGLGRL